MFPLSNCGDCTFYISVMRKSLDSAGWAPCFNVIRSSASIRVVGTISGNMIREIGEDIFAGPRLVSGIASIKSLQLQSCSIGSRTLPEFLSTTHDPQGSPILPLWEVITRGLRSLQDLYRITVQSYAFTGVPFAIARWVSPISMGALS